ncbi:L-glutamine synthetase [Methanospirillum hungatei JF-1]|jgi:glutamine synthetase|uniref:Glutamate--ammonia ligase n=1 Tax=Methanospirillum hungatei JF-1 (strain ATCC 27890 / DSM 864 / NBRC 100397 / JF-1) TaxID=323259 RepID=Q2FQ47_METHJ|nr:type I glutamate--ammonia ligase [Methanospirillum hungatei]ABD40531.1 L-glutamine synthetase [Methanospirillum hungatei JF-1]
MSDAKVSEMIARIKADNVKFIRLQFNDILGIPKNVAIPVVQVEKALTEGIWIDGSSIEGFARIDESDMILKPDISTYQILPWRPADKRVARFICDVYTYGNKPFEGDPRSVLKRNLDEAAKLGFTFNCGPELEFFVFKRDEKGQATTEFVDHGGYFDLAPSDAAEDLRREIVLALTDMGFEIEASHHEVADSQHEIDFKYGDALSVADKVITFKFAAKTLALMNGMHATFMAKPIGRINGTGMHTHGSLSKDGKNAFYDPNAENQLSETMLYYIGGLMKHAKALTRLGNPTINSYKRLVPGYEAPVYITWSAANRSAMIRVPAARGNSTRAEFRSPDPTCNPYLLFAGMIAAGLDGIKNKILPPAPTDVNIYHLSEEERKSRGIEMLPGSLIEANDELLKDKVICDALGPHIVENLTKIAIAENDEFRLTVHPWEIERYINNF